MEINGVGQTLFEETIPSKYGEPMDNTTRPV